MLKNQEAVEKKIQEMPHSANLNSKFLNDFIGHDSWTMFKLLGIDSSFVKCPVREWEESSSYLHGKQILSNLPVVNDAAERALGIATNMNTKTAPKSNDQRQDIYKIVKGLQEKLGNVATSTERVTKKALKSIDFNWN